LRWEEEKSSAAAILQVSSRALEVGLSLGVWLSGQPPAGLVEENNAQGQGISHGSLN